MDHDKRSRFRITSMAVSVLFGLGLVTLGGEFGHLFLDQRIRWSFVLPVLGFVLIAAAATQMLNMYLRGDFLRQEVSFTSTSELGASEIMELRKELSVLKTAQAELSVGNREELLEALKPSLLGGVGDELQKRYAASAVLASGIDQIRAIFAGAHSRLNKEITNLGRRGATNLSIGAGISMAAIALLFYMVFVTPSQMDTPASIASHYVPRVTLVIFIEVFAFFFLKLYKSGLDEIRSYQSELTFLSLQQVAVEAVWPAAGISARLALAKQVLIGVSKKPSPPTSNDSDLSSLAALMKALPAQSKRRAKEVIE